MKNLNDTYKKEAVSLSFTHRGMAYVGTAKPKKGSCNDEACFELEVFLNGQHLGVVYLAQDKKWRMRDISGQEMVDKIGEEIDLWYARN